MCRLTLFGCELPFHGLIYLSYDLQFSFDVFLVSLISRNRSILTGVCVRDFVFYLSTFDTDFRHIIVLLNGREHKRPLLTCDFACQMLVSQVAVQCWGSAATNSETQMKRG
jgi:hypothetical protein